MSEVPTSNWNSLQMTVSLDQFTGCLLGLAMGDALGAPHEGGPLERLVWRLIGRTRKGELRWTDDTQMSLDLGESLLAESGLATDAMAARFARSYRWSRGYGPGTARVLRRIRRGQPWRTAAASVYRGGSFGNGAAMHAPVLALYFAGRQSEMRQAAEASAQVTHGHPQGIAGAVLIASATHALLQGQTVEEVLNCCHANCLDAELSARLQTVSSWHRDKVSPTPREVAVQLGNGVAALDSCPTALHVALRHLDAPFEALTDFAIACGGDVDTIAAMAGALWGVVNGPHRLPRIALERRDKIEALAQRLWHAGNPRLNLSAN